MPLATVQNQGAEGCKNRIFYNNNREFCGTTEYRRPTAREAFDEKLGGSDVTNVLEALAGVTPGLYAGKIRKIYDTFAEDKPPRKKTPADNLNGDHSIPVPKTPAPPAPAPPPPPAPAPVPEPASPKKARPHRGW